MPSPAPPIDTFTVGIVFIKPLEMHAITSMLDEEYQAVKVHHSDKNEYTVGRIGVHNVAIFGLPIGEQGKVATALTVANVKNTFKNMALGLLVGIGGGIPRLPKNDVRLGDVVVGATEDGPAVVQYDLGKETDTEFKLKGTLNKPPPLLLRVVNKVQDQLKRRRRGEESFFVQNLKMFEEYPWLEEEYQRPSVPDRLFDAGYTHPKDEPDCSQDDKSREVPRSPRRPGDEIRIHHSTILSGDKVLKSAAIRDALSKKHYDALCFEMEAAGLMDEFPCLVIRGISDYSDSHKNSEWQHYAAATAAAYARQVLLTMSERVDPSNPGLAVSPGSGGGNQGNSGGAAPGHNYKTIFSGDNNSGVQIGHNSGNMTNNFGR